MSEPTHGEILRELGGVSKEIGFVKEKLVNMEMTQGVFREEMRSEVAALKSDNNEWKATKAGFNIVRWIVSAIVVAIGAMVGVVKVLAGGTG